MPAAPKTRSAGLRRRLLDAALPEVTNLGWTSALLAQAGRKAGLEPKQVRALFPAGICDLALYFSAEGDRQLLEDAARLDPARLPERVRDKVAFFLRARLALALPHQEAVRRLAVFFALPPCIPTGLRALAASSDAIWRASGDASTDFNYYSKRALLAPVIAQSLAVWLNDSSAGKSETADFIQRQIGSVVQWGGALGRLARALRSDALPNAIAEALAGWRYPASRAAPPRRSSAPKG